jgi:hypothetical protein
MTDGIGALVDSKLAGENQNAWRKPLCHHKSLTGWQASYVGPTIGLIIVAEGTPCPCQEWILGSPALAQLFLRRHCNRNYYTANVEFKRFNMCTVHESFILPDLFRL